MDKKVIAIIVVAIVVGIIAIVGVSLNNDNDSMVDNEYTSISTDTFVGQVIANDKYQITVIPNEEELIRQYSFEIINAIINQNTKIYIDNGEVAVEDISVGDTVKVTFDGKIYDVKPGKIVAQRLDVTPKVTEEEQ